MIYHRDMKIGRRKFLKSLAIAGAVATMGFSGCVSPEDPTPALTPTPTQTPEVTPGKVEEHEEGLDKQPLIEGGWDLDEFVGLTDEQRYRMELVNEIKAFALGLGFSETENFKRYVDELDAYHYYFYAPVTTLPYGLGDPELRFGVGTPEDVVIDLDEYDVFFFSIEAVAGVKTPVTRTLIEAPLSRFIHVVFHEEWHEQIDLPLVIEEPNAEVVSHIASMLFVEKKFGPCSEEYNALNQQWENKLRESAVYVDHYHQLETLYCQFHAKEISISETLRLKDGILESLGGEIEDIWGARPEQLNNAIIAFQMTYYRHLSLMHQVFLALNSDLERAIALFLAIPRQGEDATSLDEINDIEAEVICYLEDILDWQKAPPGR
ncbi:MAG: hypothetical protein PHY36_01020 [Methanocellales archaeon]|nr:hypothetical protein [Methanocellales archaeon]